MRVLCKKSKTVSKCLSPFLLASLSLPGTVVLADDFAKRFYINGGIGVTRVEPESSTDALTISDNNDFGGHLGAGFDINRFLTLDAYVATLGSAEVEFLGTSAGSVDYTVFGLSALGYLYNSRSGFVLGDNDTTGLFRREGASLYGRVGIGHMQNDSDRVDHRRDHPNHVAFGVGLEYGFANGFALRSEFISMDTDARYLNVGVLKRFGSAGALPVIAAAPVVASVLPEPEEPAEEPMVFEPLQAPFVYFKFDNADLSPEATAKLDKFAEQVEDGEQELQIEGHTDWIAQEAYNMSLSVRRAEAVANYLESRGISRERMTTIGYGETRPISNNDTEEGRALNRRAEIIVR